MGRPTGVYRISISDVPNLSRFWSERQVTVGQYNGTILKVQDPGTRSTAGQTFIEWQWPLHSGRAFGWTWRILVFLTGLACPVLFVTGLIRWLQKRKANKLKNKDGKRLRGLKRLPVITSAYDSRALRSSLYTSIYRLALGGKHADMQTLQVFKTWKV